MFTKLTIGDGLVSQVPALLISLAAGLLVTRSTQPVNLPAEFLQQLFSRPRRCLWPAVSWASWCSRTCPGAVADDRRLRGLAGLDVQRQTQRTSRKRRHGADGGGTAKKPEERIEDYLAVDPMEMEIGVGLIRLADPNRGGDLLPRITGVRQSVASEIGIVLPKVPHPRQHATGRTLSTASRSPTTPWPKGLVYPDRLLAMESGVTSGKIPGEETRTRHSSSRRSGSSRACGSGRRCWATRPSNRRPYWPRI